MPTLPLLRVRELHDPRLVDGPEHPERARNLGFQKYRLHEGVGLGQLLAVELVEEAGAGRVQGL